MKLPIGENIKALRLSRGTTQEQLAEAMGVSCQSVSRWETCACYPDVELLPALASYFGVTLDALMGLEALTDPRRRHTLFTAILDKERQGRWQEAISLLRQAVAQTPGDDALLAELALSLSRTGDARDRTEAIALSEQVLARCISEKLRSTVRANLCFLYRDAGLHDHALAAGRTLPHIWECREVLLPGLAPASERPEALARSFSIAHQVLRDAALNQPIAFSLGYKQEADAPGDALLQLLRGETTS